jgi:hypothetical protein
LGCPWTRQLWHAGLGSDGRIENRRCCHASERCA